MAFVSFGVQSNSDGEDYWTVKGFYDWTINDLILFIHLSCGSFSKKSLYYSWVTWIRLFQ